MNFQEFASHMYPAWIWGALVFVAILAAGQKSLLRIEGKPVFKWIIFLAAVTLWRLFLYKVVSLNGTVSKQVNFLPPLVALTVWWEDMCHGVPLLILRKLIGVNKWTRPIHLFCTLATMLSFGMGHLYQGPLAACILSLYIPYSVRKGEQYGFGTIMICHMSYDLATMLFVSYISGA